VRDRGADGLTHPSPGARLAGLNAAAAAYGAFAAALAAALLAAPILGVRGQFLALTALVIAYGMFETLRVRHARPSSWLLDPAVLCTLVGFVLGLGLTNLAYADPDAGLSTTPDGLGQLGGPDAAYATMAHVMSIAAIALAALWIGYRAPIGTMAARTLHRLLPLRRWLVVPARPRWPLLGALLAVALVARLAQVRLGVFGYSGSSENFVRYASVTSYLAYASALSLAVLCTGAFAYFNDPDHPRWLPPALVVLFVYEVVVSGFLSGFKSSVLVPFVALAGSHYTARGHLRTSHVIGAVLALAAAYAVIEPFRIARYANPDFRGSDIFAIARTMATAREQLAESGGDETSPATMYAQQLVQRSGGLVESAKALQYLDRAGSLQAVRVIEPDAPDIIGRALLSPAIAFVPRAVWPGKPSGNIGQWVTVYVWDRLQFLSSTGMSPVAAAYLGGGLSAVIIGFAIVGIVHRTIFETFAPLRYGGLIVLLGLMPTLAMLPWTFYDYFPAVLRLTPILIVGQFVLLQREARR